MRTPQSDRIAGWLAGSLEKYGTSAGNLRGWKTRKKLLPPVGRKKATRMVRSSAELAETAHAGQMRGHGHDVPYFEHPKWIAGRLAERDDTSPYMVAAAFLHDTVEDTDTTLADVEAAAGPEVAELVDWLTDKFTRESQPGMNRRERKKRENARLAGAPHEAKVIKLLDRLSNLGDLRAAKPRFQRVYADESDALLKDALAGTDAGLEDEVAEAIARLRQWADEGMDEVPVPRPKKWIAHAPGMPHDTLAEHTGPDGRLTPERRVLHDRIVRDALERVPDTPAGATPVAILMVGTPGSGKSTLADNLAGGDAAHVEADLYKQQLPEYRESMAAGARDAGGITHEEGKHIAERVWAEALDQNKSVLYDATGSWIGQYRDKIRDLRERGYEVNLVMPDVSVDEALRRVRERFRATGRTVPERAVREVAEYVAYNFRKLRHEVDGFMLFDNGGDAPRLVWEAKGGEETVHDESYVERFRARTR